MKDHLNNVPKLVAFIDLHVPSTPYSYSIQKCSNVAYFGKLCTPVENIICDLVMQRQSTPQTDTKRRGNFMSRMQALVENANSPRSVVDFSALPSAIGDPMKVETSKTSIRDTKVTKALNLKSWDANKVWGILK